MNENYYDVLNVDKKASLQEIRKAYHKLAIKYHPDKSESDPDRFKKISEAYTVLSDNDKKRQYDMTGFSDFLDENPVDLFEQLMKDFKPDMFSNFSDNLNNSFGGGNVKIKTVLYETNISNDLNDKIKKAVPDIMNTFSNVLLGTESNVDNPNKVDLVKKLMETTSSLFMNNTSSLNEKSNLEDTIFDSVFDNIDSDDNSFNNDDSLIKEDIINSNMMRKKPKDLIIKKNILLKDFYDEVQKKYKFKRYDIKGDKEIKISEIIPIPLYYNQVIKFKGKGHILKNYKERGDLIFEPKLIEDDDFKVKDYHLIYAHDISITDLYIEFDHDIILPNNEKLCVKCKDLYKLDNLVDTKINLGLPIPNEDKRGDLYIKYNLIYNDITNSHLEIILKIFPSLNTYIDDDLLDDTSEVESMYSDSDVNDSDVNDSDVNDSDVNDSKESSVNLEEDESNEED
jgi:DnaJ-class molecular chaperone